MCQRHHEIPLGDLIGAGLWRPADGDDEDLTAAIGRTKAERRLEETRLAMERANARIEALLAALEERRDEIAYLRGRWKRRCAAGRLPDLKRGALMSRAPDREPLGAQRPPLRLAPTSHRRSRCGARRPLTRR